MNYNTLVVHIQSCGIRSLADCGYVIASPQEHAAAQMLAAMMAAGDSDGDGDYEDYNEYDGLVHPYCTNVPDHLGWDIPNELCLGLEAEFLEVDTAAELLTVVDSADGRAIFKSDSSCGVELVSVPLPPAEMLSYINGLKIAHLSVDRNCGVHIHISRKYITQSQLGGLVVFMNHPDNLWYVETVANRSPNSYCQFKSGKSDTVSSDRYEMVNLTNTTTIEVRIFAGTNSTETLKVYVEWLLDLLKWLGTNPTSYLASDFLAFINS